MSFPRHEGIFRSDGRGSCRSGARSERLHAPTHRLDEFPTGYSSAGWSPPEPASASPAEQKFTMKAAPQPSLFQRMGKPCLAGCLTTGVHPRPIVVAQSIKTPVPISRSRRVKVKGGADILQFTVELAAELADGGVQAGFDAPAVGFHDLTAPTVLQDGKDDQNNRQAQDQEPGPQRPVY